VHHAASNPQLQVQCFVQENVVHLIPPISATARQELALYTQKQEKRDTAAAEQHRINYQQRALAQVQFLCKLAGPQALTKHAAALLKVPRMPTELTTLIQRAGLQLTEAQLVAAARERVEGLGSWVVQPYCLQLDQLVQAICGSELVSVYRDTCCPSNKRRSGFFISVSCVKSCRTRRLQRQCKRCSTRIARWGPRHHG
jgi:hypothetical protein